MNTFAKVTLSSVLMLGTIGIVSTSIVLAKGDHKRPSFEELDANNDGFITTDEMKQHRINHMMSADSDGDGAVTQEELQAKMQERTNADKGHHKKHGQKHLDRMFKHLDADKDGKITKAEAENAGEHRKGKGHRMMKRIDADEDGKISKAEYDTAKWHHGKQKEASEN